MGGRSRATVRFAVGAADGDQSTIWRLWTHGSEVYLAPRIAGARWKFSFHEGGRCHWGFESEDSLLNAVDRSAAAKVRERFPDIWEMPAPFTPGWRRAFTIIVPTTELRRPKGMRPTDSVWWLKPTAGFAVSGFALLLGPIDATEPEDVPRQIEAASAPQFGAVLENGATVWVLAYAERTLFAAAADQLERTRQQLRRAGADRKATGFLDPVGYCFGSADDGSRFWLEVGTP